MICNAGNWLTTRFFVKRELCPACDSHHYSRIFSSDYLNPTLKRYLTDFYGPQGKVEFAYLEDATYALEECHDCGLVFQSEVPNDFLMEKLYEKWIDPEMAIKQHCETDDLNRYSGYAREVMVLIKYFNRIPSRLHLLDFGMGWGSWCMMAKAFGCKCYGTELSESRIGYAIGQGVEVLKWKDIPEYQFDFINIEQVLEHIPKPLATLRYLKQALKLEGLIKVSVPDGGDVKRRLATGDWTAPKGSRNSLNIVSPLEHINCFSRRTIIKMAEVTGLAIVDIPLRIELASSTNWQLVKPALKNILRPIYRTVLHRGTYVFLRQKKSFKRP
jgi:transcription elongation factor Elf1